MSSGQSAGLDSAVAPKARILIVEDDAELAHTLQAHLQSRCYDVRWAADGGSGLELASLEKPDLVLLDVGLPTMSGYDVCRRLRAESNVLIVFMTSARSEEDIVTGLYQGADGYICKPFGLAELGARVEAALRRRTRYRRNARPPIYDDGTLYVDADHGIVRLRDQDVPLAPKERHLLCYLVDHAGEVVSHQELLQTIWGVQYRDARNYLFLYMRYLRRKIEDDPAHPRYLLTRFGVGYSFGREAEAEETAHGSDLDCAPHPGGSASSSAAG